MAQNKVFEDFTKLMTDASEMAQGVRREAETAMKSQLERLLATMNVVTREEFEAVKEMAAKARDENEKLTRPPRRPRGGAGEKGELSAA